MRLTRLELRNFKAFEHLDLTLEPATVLVGANDAGKSTIVEAIALVLDQHIFRGSLDRSFPQVVRDPSSVGLMMQPHDIANSVSIVGTFEDLNEAEAASWQDLIGDRGRVRVGRRWSDKMPSGERCLVVDDAQLDMLKRIFERELGHALTDELLETDPVDREHWCSPDILLSLGYARHDPPSQLMGRWPTPDDVIRIPGPEEPVPEPALLLRPIIRSLVARQTGLPSGHDRSTSEYPAAKDFGELLEPIVTSADTSIESISQALDGAVPKYVEGAQGASVHRYRYDTHYAQVERVIDELTGDVDVSLVTAETTRELGASLARSGAGVRRAALLSTLELYRDADLWSPDRSLFLLVEEPEAGLHPGAQRRVARALAEIPAFGLQTIVVTHSPTVVNAFPPSALRLVHKDPSGAGSSVVLPERLQEVGRDLGLEPSDVLLPRRFVVVEGKSDERVIGTWARTVGVDFDASAIKLVAADGESRSARVAQLLEIAYEGASFVVLLDGGVQTEATAASLRSQFGERVEVRRLMRDQIEAYYTPNAVKGWLTVIAGSLSDESAADVDTLLSDGTTKDRLKQLAGRYLGRYYGTEEDGVTIARMMREEDISLEVRELLYDLASLE